VIVVIVTIVATLILVAIAVVGHKRCYRGGRGGRRHPSLGLKPPPLPPDRALAVAEPHYEVPSNPTYATPTELKSARRVTKRFDDADVAAYMAPVTMNPMYDAKRVVRKASSLDDNYDTIYQPDALKTTTTTGDSSTLYLDSSYDLASEGPVNPSLSYDVDDQGYVARSSINI